MELTFSSTSTSTWEGSYYLDINRVEKSSVSASFSFLEQDAALQVLGGQSPGGQSWPVSHHEKQVWGPFGAWQRVGVTRSSRETIPSTIKFTGNILEKKGKAGLVREWGGGSYCLLSIEFQFGMMRRKFWIWIVGMVAQHVNVFHATEQYFIALVFYHDKRMGEGKRQREKNRQNLKIVRFLINSAEKLLLPSSMWHTKQNWISQEILYRKTSSGTC